MKHQVTHLLTYLLTINERDLNGVYNQFSETYGVTSYGSGWRKDGVTSYGSGRRKDGVTSYGSGWRKNGVTSYGSGWRKDGVTSYGSGWRKNGVTSYGSGWRKDGVNRCSGPPCLLRSNDALNQGVAVFTEMGWAVNNRFRCGLCL